MTFFFSDSFLNSTDLFNNADSFQNTVKKKVDLTQKNKATYHNQLFKLTQLATGNLKTLVHLMNKSQSTEC